MTKNESTPLYSIWVIEYAYAPEVPAHRVIYGANGAVRIPYAYAVIKGNGHVIMVDVGYNARDHGKALGDQNGVLDWHSPTEALAEIGLKPEDVDTVFITHAHFDHIGNLEAFPNARVFLQEREVARSLWALSQPSRMAFVATAIDPGDILRCVELARAGKLVLIDGELSNVLPGIDLRVAYDTHTPASMWVVVRNDGKESSDDAWVLAGDLVYVYGNIEGEGTAAGRQTMYRPVGVAMGSQTNLVLATEEMMKAVAYETRRVVPVHEDHLIKAFPSRTKRNGLRVSEVCLGHADKSWVA